jgi:cellulose synthase/poly-beta-1,6-N-acetylglucosamine synthase-like glycosyltransferase
VATDGTQSSEAERSNEQAGEEIGFVVIGRNEGERLQRCLDSLPRGSTVVYVDSGSTDGSPEVAAQANARVVALDRSAPFTAARGRNAGLERLESEQPPPEFVQLIDGDCVLASGWLSAALAEIRADPRLAVVCGRRRERFPDASVYNLLCDLEWNRPVGDATECGGDALVRREALASVGGFRGSMIAGEEPELCFRLRAAGWKIRRIAAEMTEHDAAIHHLRQWWKRQMRAGYAYALCFSLHGSSPERFRGREVRSILFWALAVPAAAFVAGAVYEPLALLVLTTYAILYLRVRKSSLKRDPEIRHARIDAAFCLLGKFAQLGGLARFASDRVRGTREELIEYK